ncbi:MAG TPA: PEGA domain-containing protein [Candidatus Binatia bacterium]|nr:PEGA domain-containing protein [Candidatus Binatia bacterium]
MTVLFLVGLGAACTINLPYDVLDDYDAVLVRMEVTPDDADVLLNGRLIGVAYEFSTPRSALRLASRQNEIVFKKQGYAEASVDLNAYSSRNITLRINLEQPEPKAAAAGPAATSEQEAYTAKTEPAPPPPPGEKPAAAEDRAVTLVILTVTPAEAAIYIDGKFWGLAPEAAKIENLRLRPGKYVFEAFKPGFKAYKKEISVPKGEKFALAIALQK